MTQRDQLNGFTGFSHRGPGFVSASDAIRQAESESRLARDAEEVRRAGFAARQAQLAQTGHGLNTQLDAARRSNLWGKPGSVDIFRFARDKQLDDNLVPQFDPDKLARIPEEDRRWSWIEIDLNAIRHNAASLRSRLERKTRLMAVVKADAYGHGAVKVAKTALNSGADYLGVASVDEAIELREAYVNAPILVLCEPPVESIPLLLGYKIMPSIYTAEFAVQYAEAADAFGLRAPFHLKVNTGMNRIGLHHGEVVPFLRQVGFHRALDLVGTYTHFATADCAET
ncbi:MAG: alanine racemase, partial [Eggerthellaceae bacterium]|nr:alanine racemase [Eggerthellaceae bacterium]